MDMDIDMAIGAKVNSDGEYVIGAPVGIVVPGTDVEGSSVDSVNVGVNVGVLVSGTGARVVASADGALVGAIGVSVTGVSLVGGTVGESVALVVGELVGETVGGAVGGFVAPKGQNSRIGGSNRVNDVHPALWPSTKTG